MLTCYMDLIHFLATLLQIQIPDNGSGKGMKDGPTAGASAPMGETEAGAWLDHDDELWSQFVKARSLSLPLILLLRIQVN